MNAKQITLPIEHEGHRYQYQILCSGGCEYAPTLLLGGAFQSMKSLQWFAEALLHRTNVILADLPGSGDSDILPPELGADYLADCVLKILDRHEISRVNLVGVSFGSAIAYALAQRNPERVENLVLIGTMSHVDERMRQGLELSLETLNEKDMERFADQVSRVLLNYEQADSIVDFQRTARLLHRSIEHMSALEIEQFRTNSRRLLTHEKLDLTNPPHTRALILTGEHDPLTTPLQCRKVVDQLPNAELALVANADHLAPLQRLDVCVRLVDSFLRHLSLEGLRGCADPDLVLRSASQGAAEAGLQELAQAA